MLLTEDAIVVTSRGGLLLYGILLFAILIIIVVLVLLIHHIKNKRSFDDQKSSVCPNCGAVLIEGKNFCTKCGTNIKSE